MSDQLFTGEKLRILTVIDNFSKLSIAIGVGYKYRACDVVLTLEKAVLKHGKPKIIQVDNGPEFIGSVELIV